MNLAQPDNYSVKNLAFLDLETTGLDIRIHSVVEIGIITDSNEYSWFMELSQSELLHASREALELNKYFERLETESPIWKPEDRAGVAKDVSEILNNKFIVGANSSFDAKFISKFLLGHGFDLGWNYKIIDVYSMALGHAGANHPNITMDNIRDYIREELKVPITPKALRHQALYDAKWAMDIYQAIKS